MLRPITDRIRSVLAAAESAGDRPVAIELSTSDLISFGDEIKDTLDLMAMNRLLEVTFQGVLIRGGPLSGLFSEGMTPWRPL